jgi:hypothetical protein
MLNRATFVHGASRGYKLPLLATSYTHYSPFLLTVVARGQAGVK